MGVLAQGREDVRLDGISLLTRCHVASPEPSPPRQVAAHVACYVNRTLSCTLRCLRIARSGLAVFKQHPPWGSTSLILELRRDDAYSLVTLTSDARRLDAALGDRYRVERELGAGGMATVYLAHDLKHDRKVAIKVLKPELAAVIGADRFLREIKTIASLQHPHILGLIDSGEVDGTAFYVMPFVEGESLRDLLKREKQLPIGDA